LVSSRRPPSILAPQSAPLRAIDQTVLLPTAPEVEKAGPVLSVKLSENTVVCADAGRRMRLNRAAGRRGRIFMGGVIPVVKFCWILGMNLSGIG
jgi:hypothetical protein